MLSVKMNRQRNPKRIEKLETEMYSWAVVWSQEYGYGKGVACAYNWNSKGSTLHDPHAFTAQSFPIPIDMKLSFRTSSLGSQWLKPLWVCCISSDVSISFKEEAELVAVVRALP